MGEQPLGPVGVTGRDYRGISVSITPQSSGFVPCIVCFDHDSGSELSLKADIELITFRDLQISLNGTERISGTRDAAKEPEACTTRSRRRGS